MKTFLSILLVIVASTHCLLAQTTTLTFPEVNPGTPIRHQDIQVLAGEVFEMLTWGGTGNSVLSFLKVDDTAVKMTFGPGSNAPLMTPAFVVAGPKTISIDLQYNESLVCTYRLTTATPLATQNVASQAVVIPENATAPVDVIYESSTDLINCTVAVAGSYAPSASKRFFRVRTVLH